MSDDHKIVRAHEQDAPLHPLVRLAMRGSEAVDPAAMRELLAVQREWEAGESRKAFDRALRSLKADLPSSIEHDKTVRFKDVRYTHTSLAAALDAVTPALSSHGFSLTWTTQNDAQRVTVTAHLRHEAGHEAQTTLSAPVDRMGGKSETQGVASTCTLLRRYTALALLGIATREQRDPEPDASAVAPLQVRTRALGALGQRGMSEAEVVRLAGAPFDAWTAEHVARLRAEYARLEPQQRQPGEEG